MRAFPFATLVTNGPDGILASHLPMLLDPGPAPYGTLRCHFARANAHWTAVEGSESLVIFGGPNAYITPSWYEAKAETGRVVPTWNYVVVHARGRPRVFHDAERLHTLVSELTEIAESPQPEPWAVSDAPERFTADQLRGIVGIEIPVRELIGKWKLSQNRPAADRERIVAGLAVSEDSAARATASAMETARPTGP